MNLWVKIGVCILLVALMAFLVGLGWYWFHSWRVDKRMVPDPISPFLIWLGVISVFFNLLGVIKRCRDPRKDQIRGLKMDTEILKLQTEIKNLRAKLGEQKSAGGGDNPTA